MCRMMYWLTCWSLYWLTCRLCAGVAAGGGTGQEEQGACFAGGEAVLSGGLRGGQTWTWVCTQHTFAPLPFSVGSPWYSIHGFIGVIKRFSISSIFSICLLLLSLFQAVFLLWSFGFEWALGLDWAYRCTFLYSLAGTWRECPVPSVRMRSMSDPYAYGWVCVRSPGGWKSKKSEEENLGKINRNMQKVNMKHTHTRSHWLERRICDWKVASSNPGGSDGRIFFSRINFVCWLLFGVRSNPVLL